MIFWLICLSAAMCWALCRNLFLRCWVQKTFRCCQSSYRLIVPPLWGRSQANTGKFLNSQDKMKVLWLACGKGKLMFAGAQVFIYPDYSAALVQKRRLFDSIKRKLREKDIKCSLLYSATLSWHRWKVHFVCLPRRCWGFFSEPLGISIVVMTFFPFLLWVKCTINWSCYVLVINLHWKTWATTWFLPWLFLTGVCCKLHHCCKRVTSH